MTVVPKTGVPEADVLEAVVPEARVPPETGRAAARRLTALFAAAGLDTPDLDARLLLAHALQVNRLQLLMDQEAMLQPAAARHLSEMAARRLAHEPVSRIVGERSFYGRPFKITPATLDPRPDSETLVEAACALMRDAGISNENTRLLDIGTGTGCLLLTLLGELPGARGWGTDVSIEALAVAEANLVSHRKRLSATEHAAGALRHVDLRHGSAFSPVEGMTFNLIVSNPPYIPTPEIGTLDPEVRQFDPILALDGGTDGLDIYRLLISQISDYLSDGWLVFEVGEGQALAVAELLQNAFSPAPLDLRVFKDLAGVQRCVAARPRPIP